MCLLSCFSCVRLFVTLWTDSSLPGSSVHEILQTNTGVTCYALFQGNLPNLGIEPKSHLSCIARRVLYHQCHLGSPVNCMKVKVTRSCPNLCSHGLHSPWNSPGQNTGVGSLSLLQEIFPTQGSNPGLPHCGRILYQLSHGGIPTILEWVAFPFSSGSSQTRN